MAKVKDPVCGMMVDTEKVVAKGQFDGKLMYFCSTTCHDQYAAAHPRS